jgi:hypothetical protein
MNLLKDDSYIIEASLVQKAVKNFFSSASRTVDRADNVIMYENEPIFCKSVNFTMNDMNLDGYFHHDPKRWGAMKSLQIRPNPREIIDSTVFQYLRYFTCRIEDGRIKTRTRNNAIMAVENRMDKYLLVYNRE